MTSWNKFSDEKLRLIAKAKRVLDAGGGEPFQKQLAVYKDLFKNSEYVVLDKNAVPGSGAVKGDVHNLPFLDGSFDAFICKSVLEHVEDPFKAVSELYRVLRPGGMGFVYVPFLFPYHAEKGKYADYWRFSEDGVKLLFKDFSKIELIKVRGFFETLNYFLPFFRKILALPARILDIIFSSRNQTSGFIVFLVK